MTARLLAVERPHASRRMTSMDFIRTPLSRRHFVQGLAGSALLASAVRTFSQGSPHPGASSPFSRGVSDMSGPSVLTGPDFHLTIDTMRVNYTGVTRTATTVNGQVPGPLLRMKQG